MKRLKQLALVLAVIVAALVVVRYVRHQRDRALALPMISQLGGSVGSLPFEPIGTEYCVSFRRRKFAAGDIDRLTALQPLASRNPVLIIFGKSVLTPDELRQVQLMLPAARIVVESDEQGRQPQLPK